MAVDHGKALDCAEQGHWDQAHRLVQSSSDRLSCLIHAYLHRIEGDLGNARYWYSRANENLPDNTLDEEFNRLRRMVAGP